jgi:hypothetical protein
MKLLIPLFVMCALVSCNPITESQQPTRKPLALDTTKAKPGTMIPAEKQYPKTIYLASGFEPMWNLQLLMADDGTYPINYVDVTGEMTGRLNEVSENIFEGTIKKNGAQEIKIKLVISSTPCMREDGETKDPLTATITINGKTSSGCCRKL